MIGFISFIFLCILYYDISTVKIYDHKGGVNELGKIEEYIGFNGIFE